MALTAGSRVGVFEVTGTLGAGGMGEVYRARDTTLKREVALKVLPAALADDADRVARFQREAELLATLNHPHIAAIYGLAQEGPVRALVLELVEGPTLADRIAAGPLPLDEALPLARQIADALEAAHEQGIIHRDLKPANIKLRPDGTVKVLDFGLAKALDQASGVRLQASGAPATQSPTITSPLLTQRGMILGTAAYMSPEQARGREADRRSDIWAFGGVLYEMLTGTRAFPGDEITDTLAAIVRAEPEWAKLPANTPAAIRRVLKRCLEKNAKERLPHIGAARLEIDDALAHPNEETTTPLLAMAGASSPPPRESRVAWAIALLATLGAVAALGKALWPAGAEPEGPTDELIRLEVPVPVDAGSDGRVANVAVSPDGRQLLLTFAEVGVSRQRPGVASAPLYIRSLGDATARPLPGTEGARAPFWSPDGRRAGFFTEDKLKVIELATHAVRPLCDVSGARVAGSWGNDEIVFSAGPGLPLRRVPAAGGTPTPVVESTDTGGRSVVVRPSFLADGRRFVYSTPRGVMLASLDRTGAKPFIDNATGAQVIGRDWVMFWRAATIMVQRFDEPSESIVGEPTAIAEVGLFPDPTLPLHGGAADTIVVQTVTEGRARLAWVDRAGRHLSWIGAPAVQRGVELAPDDLRVVITRGSPTERNIWLLDVRGLERRMTSAPGNEAFPLWSRDGSVVAYAASQRTTSSDYWQIRLLRPDGSSDDLVSTSGLLTSWSADGSHVLSTATYAGTGSDTLVTDLASKSAPTPFLASTSNELQAQFSPDDRWVAYVSQSGDRPEIYVTDFPARRHVLAVTTSGGVQPRWRRDGRELIYMNLDSRLVAVPVTPGSPLAFGAPVTLFEARTLEGPTARPGMNAQYDVSSDGRRFVLNLEQEPQTARLTAVINWRRLVPGDRAP